MITREEYEDRKRFIEAQHRATIELIEAGRVAQLRALDLVWLASGAGGVPLLPQLELPAFGEAARLLAAPSESEGGASGPVPAAPPEPSAPPGRRKAWELVGEIVKALEVLPEVFDHYDLCRALGYELDRGAARRNLQLLIDDGVLAPVQRENERSRLRYRRLKAVAHAAEE
ncbi:MAG: hypothetical protein ABJC13_11845 [Acidobacteriota bacterium]